ncbi:MAG TPA: maltose alpha-D-glucosyltransferase [Bryobacteraceae bacterium]|nr:maltose alpha-D-glucosyltransferase [Bryobacteraceae bacterium]
MPPENRNVPIDSDPLWYKDAIIYEVHVRAFADANGDGMGDFAGLTAKLDYLQSLGITAVWVLPFCPSPWKDDGYDISDYNDVHPAYGTLRDFEAFLREAHRRGLRVITELVLNHTSDQHVWFQRSRRAEPGSRWRNYYVWSDTPDRYTDARIIFKDFEASNWTWDPVARAYFWHRFYSHQPDLNFDNPEVRTAVLKALDFWLDLGVDGVRLDAVPYLFEREGTNCENLPETHAFLQELRAHVDAKYIDRMILGEANQWPEDAIAYFGEGNECHMAFHFPLMPRLFMSTRMEDRYPITEILNLTPAIPDNAQWALFLRNHDELTLEMVTDEERDYMYRVYAQDQKMRINLGIRRRLAPLLENDRRRIELLNALLLSLPGTPVIYYGDEIGMGDNFYLGDRNGVRTPMQWSGDRNAGFSRTNPQRLYLPVIIDPEYHYEAVNVETQHNNPHSLLWWMRRIIAQRKQSKAFGRGTLEFLQPENRRVLAFLRNYEDEWILVVANLSRFAQSAELSLGKLQGFTPVEMFGGNVFPEISDRPYALSLGPHSFYWFMLQQRKAISESFQGAGGERTLPLLTLTSWEHIFSPPIRAALARYLPEFLRTRPWFLGARNRIRLAEVRDVIPFPRSSSYLVLIRVEYIDGDGENYVLTLSVARDERAEQVIRENPQYIMARLWGPDGSKGVLYSGVRNREFCEELLGAITRRRRFQGEAGELVASHTRRFRDIWGDDRPALEPAVARGEQNNTSVIFGDRFVLKLFRRIEAGIHPEREMGAFLTERVHSAHAAPLAGALEYRSGGEVTTLALLHGYLRHEAEGWDYTLDSLGLYFEQALASGLPAPEPTKQSALVLAAERPPEVAGQLIGGYLELARLLGRRTAEVHVSLASHPEEAEFAPEPYTDFYRHGLYHGLLAHTRRNMELLRRNLDGITGGEREECERLIASEPRIRRMLQQLRDQRVSAIRSRIHGEYNLRQVLFTGKDFVLIDFEGSPDRPLSERRLKRSPIRDVAGMMRSFHYASHAVLFGQVSGVVAHRTDAASLELWADFWYNWVSASFLAGYLGVPGTSALLPTSRQELRLLLDIFQIEKGLREMRYELTQRRDWLRIPVHGILELLGTE